MSERRMRAIVALTGGLGNQMFQYAFGRMLELECGRNVEFDIHFYKNAEDRRLALEQYDIGHRVFADHQSDYTLRRLFQRIPIIRYIVGTYKEMRIYEIDEMIYRYRYRFYAGYWQNLHYYERIKSVLARELNYIGKLTAKETALLEEIRNGISIAVHIRYGDYLQEKYRSVYAQLDETYYRKAIEEALSRINGRDYTLYFFSNDIDLCRERYGNVEHAVFVDSQMSSSEHTDLLFMQNAHYIIMANSTFSWWAAYLARRNDMVVIAPTQWYNDRTVNQRVLKALLEPGWVTVESYEAYGKAEK